MTDETITQTIERLQAEMDQHKEMKKIAHKRVVQLSRQIGMLQTQAKKFEKILKPKTTEG